VSLLWVNYGIWVDVFAPAGTRQATVERLNQEINAIGASPEAAMLPSTAPLTFRDIL